ncbi:MAG: SDR family NAD(P)-dependent oxidoreductase [Actinobacteria bacterium]|jgi:short-subunit dehydrogenase|nr:SDR family NAD(P)-dependent oxidoreductase [Actinomycetota bacterium]MCL6094495.1 SDR family NAD(P)-dependent oxidoreductase [Actinomycetota bacterium]
MSNAPFSWNDKVVVITGASRGIGKAIAVLLGQRGATLGLISRSQAQLEDVLVQAGNHGAVAPADVADRHALENALNSLRIALGDPDVLINNAGIGHYGSVADAPPEVYEQLMSVNYFGTVWATKAVLPSMISRGSGEIVNIASIAGKLAAPFEAAYSATKFAVVGFTEALAIELSGTGVNVHMVNPGPVDTNFFEARGNSYQRSFPPMVDARTVALTVERVVRTGKMQEAVPRWLDIGPAAKGLFPSLYLWGAKQVFRPEIARGGRAR